MEKLAITCQVLYDNDLLDKQQEIIKLKRSLNANILPKVLYENCEEWEILKTEAIEICRRGVRSFVSDVEYPFMRNFGINHAQYQGLYLILSEAFDKISKGQANEWVSNYAQIINLTIKNTIKTLVDMGLWENIFDSLGRDGLNTFILRILMTFFEEGDDGNIGDIRYFKCSCGEIDSIYVHNECWNWH